jgi:hypothetical protein
MEPKVEALLDTVDEDILVNFRSCDVSKEIHYLKLGKTYGSHGISKGL